LVALSTFKGLLLFGELAEKELAKQGNSQKGKDQEEDAGTGAPLLEGVEVTSGRSCAGPFSSAGHICLKPPVCLILRLWRGNEEVVIGGEVDGGRVGAIRLQQLHISTGGLGKLPKAGLLGSENG